MRRSTHIRLSAVLLFLFISTAAHGQGIAAGIFQSPKGIGLTAMFDANGGAEMNIVTLRSDFYGFLSGRTERMGACLTYTHDYFFYHKEAPDFDLYLHAGAGGMLGYVSDFEKGLTTFVNRELKHNPGAVIALAGNFGVRFDFGRRLSLDISFSAAPGVHLRTEKETGAALLTYYNSGSMRAYFPQLNLMYRFR